MHKNTEKQSQLTESSTFNKHIVEAIRSKLGAQDDLSSILAGLLHLSKSAIYRKINGEVPFSLQEAALLAQRFQISFDNLILGGGNATGFMFNMMPDTLHTDVEYYRKALKATKIFAHDRGAFTMYMATREVPPYMYMHFPELTAFQSLIWSRVTLRFVNVEKEDFRIEQWAQNPDLLAVSREMIATYNALPGIEYISANILDQNISALKQFAGHPMFEDKRTPLLLCEQLEKSVKHLFHMAKLGRKTTYDDPMGNNTPEVPYTLFHDHLPNYDTVMLFKSSTEAHVLSSFDYPNFMLSSSPKMAEYVERWLHNARTHSSRISGEGELNRLTLQHYLLGKIAKLKERLLHQ
jgi:hypothetical protein